MKQSINFGNCGIQISAMIQTAEGLLMQAKSANESARCPDCGQSSFSVHTAYQRKLRDRGNPLTRGFGRCKTSKI